MAASEFECAGCEKTYPVEQAHSVITEWERGQNGMAVAWDGFELCDDCWAEREAGIGDAMIDRAEARAEDRAEEMAEQDDRRW